MPTRVPIYQTLVSHNSANFSDVQDFFQELFGVDLENQDGWLKEDPLPGDTGPGSLVASPRTSDLNDWLVFYLVESISSTITQAKNLGGSVAVEESNAPDGGKYAVLKDPGGARVGIYKAPPE